MADDDSEKTEQATDTRREEFRRRGQVAQTRELSSAAFLLVSAMSVFLLSKFFFQNFIEVFQHAFGPDLVEHIRRGNFMDVTGFMGGKMALMLLPVFGLTALVALFSSIAQVGFLMVEDALSPDFNKINPIQGFTRIFSLRTLVEGLKSFLKLVGIGFIVYLVLKSEIEMMPKLMDLNVAETMYYMGKVIVKLLLSVGSIMLVLAAADYFFQKWDLEKKMMMSKQEIKEESKQREGDPMIKSRIRRIQREIASRRMMDKVKQGDVVVTNPTHIAVVLKYGENLPAPQLIAKGADLIAEKIKAIAKENNIPIVENKPLARTIFKTMKLGQVIPKELFVAVAEVLSYVYRLKKKIMKKK